MLLGNKIKELRNKHEVLQRQLASYLEIDTPMFSKIERGDRRAKRSQVVLLAKYFHINENEMLTLWLADKVLDTLEGEDELCLDALDTAKTKLTDVNR
ncbi:helix-turn-helix domain-containing protein [Prevotella copri]|uniref:helix-turn-helix domain-containing protein n=1 Tax=Segatella copri TaxID=165179 RepID=UPI001C394917|nr:helix-turn-helix transcriptional regulator [Segatella copri]MBV3415632.1 helix-turn-helix domain-containing protein [Segatella copri]